MTRRGLLQATASAIGSLLLPGSFPVGVDDRSCWFIHADSLESWPVPDPVAWCLENARRPVLGRAAEGLRRLTPADGVRVIRLVTRRCRLNLIEHHPDRVVVHHWGHQGRADLRAFFKAHGLARREIEVIVRDRKREESVTQPGDEYLYGEPLGSGFPLGLYLGKWRRRFERQPDDRQAAPGTRSCYAWEGVEDDRIPWAALKSAWRRAGPNPCPNCGRATVLTNFGYARTGMLGRSPRFVRICGRCRRSFLDPSVVDVRGWLLANLDADVRPDFMMMWDRRKTLGPSDHPAGGHLPIDGPGR